MYALMINLNVFRLMILTRQINQFPITLLLITHSRVWAVGRRLLKALERPGWTRRCGLFDPRLSRCPPQGCALDWGQQAPLQSL